MSVVDKKLQTISQHELVDLPVYGVVGVPAKIDTGADSCAIWASDIQERDGQLHFTLFGEGSVYYDGSVIRTDEYKVTIVKNSFGEKEVRYVVKLSIKVGQKRYKVRFTLADRSRNHFPILLGKKFLKKRFLVDVGASYLLTPTEKQRHNTAFVISSRIDDQVSNFFQKVQAKMDNEKKIELVHYDDLAFWFGKDPKIVCLSTGQDLRDSGLIYVKNYKRYPEHAATIAQYAAYTNTTLRDEELGDTVSLSKLSEMMRLSCYGLPVPEGVAMTSRQFVLHADMVIEAIGLPLVLKDVFSDRGKNNHLINTKEDFLECLKEAPEQCFFVAQKYIPNDGFMRVIVLGREAPLAVFRSSVDHDDPRRNHLNKPKGGANAELILPDDMPRDVVNLAIRSSEVMRRQIAGVDLIKDTVTNEWYILEVNYNPEMVSASYLNDKIDGFANYFKNELERW